MSKCRPPPPLRHAHLVYGRPPTYLKTPQTKSHFVKGTESDATIEEVEDLKRTLEKVMGKEQLERQLSKAISIRSSHRTKSSQKTKISRKSSTQ